MRLSHIGIEAGDIERLRYWYMRYFAMTSSDLYSDAERGVRCYFLRSSDPAASTLEILNYSDRGPAVPATAHLAISTGSRQGVDFLIELLRTDGNAIVREPFVAVNGCYMGVVLDPEGNRVEITE
ncbi:MAG: VOC family protein [Muribaculaceae bacterium]|nr:VOC family protein [Muribaculaceae bacterium]MDE6331577.1 VOC family protein [Muribaculaceae bacterium]